MDFLSEFFYAIILNRRQFISAKICVFFLRNQREICYWEQVQLGTILIIQNYNSPFHNQIEKYPEQFLFRRIFFELLQALHLKNNLV